MPSFHEDLGGRGGDDDAAAANAPPPSAPAPGTEAPASNPSGAKNRNRLTPEQRAQRDEERWAKADEKRRENELAAERRVLKRQKDAAAKQAAAAESAAAKVVAKAVVLEKIPDDTWFQVAALLLYACVDFGNLYVKSGRMFEHKITEAGRAWRGLCWLYFTNKMFSRWITIKIRKENLAPALDSFLTLTMASDWRRRHIHYGKNYYPAHMICQKFQRLHSFQPDDQKVRCLMIAGYRVWPRVRFGGPLGDTVNGFSFMRESMINVCGDCKAKTPNTILGGNINGKRCNDCKKGNFCRVSTVEQIYNVDLLDEGYKLTFEPKPGHEASFDPVAWGKVLVTGELRVNSVQLLVLEPTATGVKGLTVARFVDVRTVPGWVK